jgi:hypothetical protein
MTKVEAAGIQTQLERRYPGVPVSVIPDREGARIVIGTPEKTMRLVVGDGLSAILLVILAD